MKYCSKCGAELPDEAKFCTKCGITIGQDNNMSSHSKKEPKVNKKTIYAFGCVIGVLLLIVFGSMFYSDYSEKREARLAREKFVADSLEKARKDSIEMVKQKEEEERLEEEKKLKMEACLNFVKKFYRDYEKTNQDEDFLRKHCTLNAIRTLEKAYDYDCEGSCLATWIFFYEAGDDSGPLRERDFEAEDENTFQVTSIYELEGYGQYTAYEYVVRLGVVKEGNFYKIDTIEVVLSHPIIA